MWLQIFVIENFRDFRNYMIITKFCSRKLLFVIISNSLFCNDWHSLHFTFTAFQMATGRAKARDFSEC